MSVFRVTEGADNADDRPCFLACDQLANIVLTKLDGEPAEWAVCYDCWDADPLAVFNVVRSQARQGVLPAFQPAR
jgi:hypothetical protein